MSYGEIQFVQASLLGNILVNTLFSISCYFIVGGIQRFEQDLGTPSVSIMSMILAAATASMLLPAILHFVVSRFSQEDRDMTALSHGVAIVLLLICVVYLNFQLRTHIYLFDDADVVEEGQEDEASVLNVWTAGATLVLLIALIILCAQSLVGSLGLVVDKTHSSRTFIGFIIMPFVSNVPKIMTATAVAWKDMLPLAVHVAIESSLQTILFVTPLLVVVGWITDHQLTFAFGILETVVLLLSSSVVVLILHHRTSTYLDGVFCFGMYIIIAMTMFVFADDAMA
jgi:Ca2+:H+ antiporter